MKKNEFPRRCQNCEYLQYSSGIREYLCDYITMAGKLRETPISDDCEKYQPKGKSKKPPKTIGIIK